MYVDLSEEEVALFKDQLSQYKKFKDQQEYLSKNPPPIVRPTAFTYNTTDFLYWAMVGFSIGIFFCLFTKWPKQ